MMVEVLNGAEDMRLRVLSFLLYSSTFNINLLTLLLSYFFWRTQ